MKNRSIIHEAYSTEFITPEWFMEDTRSVFGGRPDLDPCAHPLSLVRARKNYYLSKGQNGLKLPWTHNVFCNPPYGAGIAAWFRCAYLWSLGGRANTLMLVPVNSDTVYWQRYVRMSSAFCLLKGRVQFLEPCGRELVPATAPPGPSAAVLFSRGERAMDITRAFLRTFESRGQTYTHPGVLKDLLHP